MALPEAGRAPTWRSGFAFPARGHAGRRAPSSRGDRRARPRPGRGATGLRGCGANVLQALARAGGGREAPAAGRERWGVVSRRRHELHVGATDNFVPAADAHPALTCLLGGRARAARGAAGGQRRAGQPSRPGRELWSRAFACRRSVGKPPGAARLIPQLGHLHVPHTNPRENLSAVHDKTKEMP